MKLKYFLISIILLVASEVKAGDTVYWNSPLKLTWDDFKGKAGRSPSGTGSYIGIEYDLTNDQNSFKTRVYTYFLRNLSWSAYKNNDTLLQHEQLRFDMAELFARRLRKAFSEYKYNPQTVAVDIKRIFNKIKQERLEMNEQYNKETKYGTDWNAQQAWATKIGTELDRLSNYAE
jgi:hypothetical protein